MALALIAVALTRDYWRARRDQKRAVEMTRIVARFTTASIDSLIAQIGAPYETAEGTSGRALFIWKSPPNDQLPPGSGLLTVTVTVEAGGAISSIEWRDRT